MNAKSFLFLLPDSLLLLIILSSLSACNQVTTPRHPQQGKATEGEIPLENLKAEETNATLTDTPTPEPVNTVTPSPTAIDNEHIVWKFDTGGAIWGTPALYEDTVVVGSDDGKLYTVDFATGQQKWAFQTNGIVRSRPAFGSSFGKSTVYFSSDDGNLYALDAQDGQLLWQTDIGNITEPKIRQIIGSSPSATGYDYVQSSPIVENGVIFIGSADGRILAVTIENGEILWAYQTGAQVRATPTIDDGTLFVGSWDKSMYALEAQTGELRWQVPIGGQIQTTALVSENLVFSASRKASVIALDKETGEPVWEFDYGNNMWVESSPTLAGSVLYIGSSGTRTVFGLDSKTGEMLLAYNIGLFCWSKPMIIEQNLVIGCTNFNAPIHQGLNVLEISPTSTDGKSLALVPQWQVQMGKSIDICGNWSGVASSPINAAGFIFFGGLDGSLYAVEL